MAFWNDTKNFGLGGIKGLFKGGVTGALVGFLVAGAVVGSLVFLGGAMLAGGLAALGFWGTALLGLTSMGAGTLAGMSVAATGAAVGGAIGAPVGAVKSVEQGKVAETNDIEQQKQMYQAQSRAMLEELAARRQATSERIGDPNAPTGNVDRYKGATPGVVPPQPSAVKV